MAANELIDQHQEAVSWSSSSWNEAQRALAHPFLHLGETKRNKYIKLATCEDDIKMASAKIYFKVSKVID